MSEPRHLRTWNRLLHGRPIKPARARSFLRHLARDAELRDAILADLTLHGALRTVAHCQGDGADFVQRTLDRIKCETAEAVEPTSASPSEPNPDWGFTSRLPVAPPAVHPMRQRSWGVVVAIVAVLLVGVLVLLRQVTPRLSETPLDPVGSSMAIRPTPPIEADQDHAPVPAPKTENVASPPSPVASAPELSSRPSVARLVKTENCRWKASPPEGALAPGVLELLGGGASIAFEDGPTLQLTGPCTFEIRGRDQASLREGLLRAEGGVQGTRFLLETPTSALTARGTRADIEVHADGGTDVLVYQGELDIESRALDGTPTDRCRVGIGGHKHVEAVARANQPLNSAAFKGVLSVNGETREFTDANDYEQARQRVMAELEEFTEQLPKNLLPAVPGGVQGRIEINGQKFEFQTPEAILEAQKRLLEQLGVKPVAGVVGGRKQNFAGQITINGKQFEFSGPQSLEELRRRLLQPLQPPQRVGPR